MATLIVGVLLIVAWGWIAREVMGDGPGALR